MAALSKIKRLAKELWKLSFMLDERSYARFLWAIFVSLPAIARSRSLSVPHSRMWGHPVTFKVKGQKITLDGKWFGYAAETYGRGIYSPRKEFAITPGMRVVDLGASGGIFSILAAKLGAEVVAVEANRKSFEELQMNAEQNGVGGRVRAVWGLIGSGSGDFADPANLRAVNSEAVPVISMEDLLREKGLGTVDFLKVDIEGSEYDLIRNSSGWLPKVKLIAMEVERNYGDPKELAGILERAGFTVWILDNDLAEVKEITETSGYIFAKRNEH